jgi:type IV pilus assembly protein PilV
MGNQTHGQQVDAAPGGQAGFSLVEVLVAMVILVIGVMGLAAMQDISLGSNKDANEISRVTALATDMMDRINYNKANVAQYNNMNTAVACPLVQTQARGDCLQWTALVTGSRLPNAQGTVAVVGTGPVLPGAAAPMQNVVTIQITWSGGSTLRPKRVTMQSALSIE